MVYVRYALSLHIHQNVSTPKSAPASKLYQKDLKKARKSGKSIKQM